MINKELIIKNFMLNQFNNEDDVKIHAYSEIFKPLKNEFAPTSQFHSEKFIASSRPDGTISNIIIEYKKYDYFSTSKGKNEALYGRKNQIDSGVYQYIINSIDSSEIDDTICDTFGVCFDGVKWIVARFVHSSIPTVIDLRLTKYETEDIKELECNYKFLYNEYDLSRGIEQLISIFKSTEKKKITKETLSETVNPSNNIVHDSILTIYSIIKKELSSPVPTRVTTLYNEWEKTFGTMFSEETQETEFNRTADAIKRLYKISTNTSLNSKLFLFATQTYFNIFLKIMINGFLRQINLPSQMDGLHMEWTEIVELFEGKYELNSRVIDNFYEVHYYEWFTYSGEPDHIDKLTSLVNQTIDLLNVFDLGTYKVRPEEVQDILQEIYMTLIPSEMRHLLGEYFSPDWIVEFALDRIGYEGEIDKKLIDPCSGSGAFIIQAIKKVIQNCGGKISTDEAKKITENIIGFDLNPISAVTGKANYIIALMSSIDNIEKLDNPLTIPIYIADSVLSPIVYSEESDTTFVAKTSVGDFVIPKFTNFPDACYYLDTLSESIDKSRSYKVFISLVNKKLSLTEEQQDCSSVLYHKLMILHRSAQDSFWGKILKNSFSPVMLKRRFDYVVGNPPWIAWKAMSKTYREGTLDVWLSYGIFEKNAYDKKTTHDDFAMAVTYVSLDQYLHDDGKLFFLLPYTFFKSTKGGEGFRKLMITRNKQETPISVEEVNDFTNIKIFKPKHTVRTIGVLFKKNKKMVYPMNNWYEWTYSGDTKDFNAHSELINVLDNIQSKRMIAQPINSDTPQSAWMTLESKELEKTKNILLNGEDPYYRGRKGIEPAGAKGVYILKKPRLYENNKIVITNDISRSRRPDVVAKGEHTGVVENTFVYPMLGGRNIKKWKVISNEFMIVPHTSNTPYGLDETTLINVAPETHKWLEYFKKELLDSRIQSGKFFNPEIQPWYRLDNVGDYTFSKYKVFWKEQSKNFAAVVVGSYSSLPYCDMSIFSNKDKVVVCDSKVLMLSLNDEDEAYYVCGVINSSTISKVIDSYAIGLNRGIDILDNIKIYKYNKEDLIHKKIVEKSKLIHSLAAKDKPYQNEEKELDKYVMSLYENKK